MDKDSTDFLKTIIWLAIFVFWVGYQFFKKLIGTIKKDVAPQPRKNGLSVFSRGSSTGKKITSLRDSLRDFFEEVTKMQKPEKPESPPPQKKPEPKPVPRKKPSGTEQVPKAAHKPEVCFGSGDMHGQERRRSGENRPDLSGCGLRNAVVFSEILAPPLALRDTDDRQF